MGFPKWTVLIVCTGFDTIPSMPDPTQTEFNRNRMIWRALSVRPSDEEWRYLLTTETSYLQEEVMLTRITDGAQVAGSNTRRFFGST